MVCPGFFLKKLLDFTYIRSKDDEKIISLDRIDDRNDLDGVDGKDRGPKSKGD